MRNRSIIAKAWIGIASLALMLVGIPPSSAHGRVAKVLARQGDTAGAPDLFREGRAIIARLKGRSPDSTTLSNDLK